MTIQTNVLAAMERLDAAIERQKVTQSKQSRFSEPMALFNSVMKWIKRAENRTPLYTQDSRMRDKWLREYWREEPHLAGVINSVVSVDKNRGWSITAGRNQTLRFERILRDAEAGQGWRYFMSQASLSYYTSDMGAVIEVGRDIEGGPLRSLYYTDPVACRLTGNPETPLEYYDVNATKHDGFLRSSTGGQSWTSDDFFRVAPLPNNDQTFGGLGYCAVSRVLRMAEIMIGVYEHNLERLLARAPRGVMFLQNVAEHQWLDAMKATEAQMSQKEREFFGALMVIATQGSEPPDGKLLSLSQLPDGFDIEKMTNLLMYAYALCFGYDPIEFWPVSAGALGRGRETDIQHRKGTGKGGKEFTLSLQDQLQRELPETVLFQFEERDAEGELLDADIAKRWGEVINLLYSGGMGVLTKEQAMMYLAEKGVVPAEWTATEEDTTVDDEGVERASASSATDKRKLKRLREQALESDHVQRAIHQFPKEPIIRRYWPSGKTVVLWESGDEVKHRHLFPVPDLRDMSREIRRPRVARAKTLYEGDGFDIIAADVEAAIVEGGERLGEEFEGLLRAEEE